MSAYLSFPCAWGLSLFVVLLVAVVNPMPNPSRKTIDLFCYIYVIYLWTYTIVILFFFCVWQDLSTFILQGFYIEILNQEIF